MNIQHETILLSVIQSNPTTLAAFTRAKTRICNQLKTTQPANRHLLEAYQNLAKKKRITKDKTFEEFLRKAAVRSQSGIAIITSLVKPYMCPGKCIYCPTEVRMPKSYIATEPAAARALRLDFSPYEQMRQRIEMLETNGHPTDKIEFIIKGGTWNTYPLQYQYWFILESLRACNNVRIANLLRQRTDPPEVENMRITQLNEHSPLFELQAALEIEQRKNERAKHRLIGITLETRPDAISPRTIAHMRRQGCTRIELGLQTPDDEILNLIRRGHTVQQFTDAMFLLRQAGFKVDLHFMPDLPGTTAAHDVTMYKSLFSDPGLKPDMVKIYPNTVIKSAELYQWFLDGRYQSYGDESLFEALLEMKLATPRWCRISRLIRDIPETEIEHGNKITNLRELLAARLKEKGLRCQCLRCREIGRVAKIRDIRNNRNNRDIQDIDESCKLFIEQYETTGGIEYFLSHEDKERNAVFGFLRLRIPTATVPADLLKLLPELKTAAFIRELHVYGQQVRIHDQKEKASQHKGLGKKLVEEAEKIAKTAGFKKLAIISGVGVRGYYRKLGYRKVETYMVKKLK